MKKLLSLAASVLGDARFALRLLARSPGYALTLLGVLALGIGATTAMFSIASALLLRPLPYRDAEQLTMIWKTHEPLAREWPASIPDFVDYHDRNKTFSKMAAATHDSFSLASDGARAEYVGGVDVTGEFFEVFGVQAVHGRLLGPADDKAGGPPVCVVSADLWRRRFAGDPSLVGRTITLSGRPFTVVGVVQDGFRMGGPYGDRIDVWAPLAVHPTYPEKAQSRGNNHLWVMGRRKPGVTLAEAQADMSAIAAALAAEYPRSNAHRGLNLVDLHEALVGKARPTVFVLFGAVALVFLVVCANVASLLLARGATRRGEMAARAALGATRARLVRQLVTESVVVFGVGGALGALAARWMVGFFADAVRSDVWAANVALGVDGAALAFALGVSLVAGVAFGVVPALATSRVAPQAVLKETAAQAGVSRAQRIARSGLVVAQVAVAFALLVGSGLAVRGFARVASAAPGFDPSGMVVGRLNLPETTHDDDAVLAFGKRLEDELRRSPNAIAVATNSAMPMVGTNSNGWFKIEGRNPWPSGEGPILERNVVSPGYFAAMGIPILRGREFTEADAKDGRKVLVISQTTAATVFPGEDPIGKRIDLGASKDDEWMEIVGVAGDTRRRGPASEPVAEAYVSSRQIPSRWVVVAVRSRSPEASLGEIKDAVNAVDPRLATYSRQRMQDRIDDWTSQQRTATTLLAAFSAAALLLSMVGLFGLVSYTTSQRTREIGLRVALGSTPGAVIGLVMKSGGALVGLGLVVGAALAAIVARALTARLPGVEALDPAIFAAIPALVGASALLACLAPAWRAAKIPPSVALRYE